MPPKTTPGHRHHFRVRANNLNTAYLRCECGAETDRPTTAEEKRAHRAMWRRAKDVHRVWHAFAAKFIHPKSGAFRKKGYPLIEAVEAYAARRKDIEILRCDDGCYAGSRLVFVRHRSKEEYHGTTVIFIPQCTGEDPTTLFLYPNHAVGLMEHLLGEIRVMRTYRKTHKEMLRNNRWARQFGQGLHGRKKR